MSSPDSAALYTVPRYADTPPIWVLYAGTPGSLEKVILFAENLFSLLAAVPALGVVPSGLKLVLGLGQVGVGGIGVGLCAISSIERDSRRSVYHIKHGLGNMGAAALEAIPLVSTVLIIVRVALMIHRREYNEGNGLKFMPYKSW